MTILRDTIAQLSRLCCDFTPEEVAKIADVSAVAAVRYCNILATIHVLDETSPRRFMAGSKIEEWRTAKPIKRGTRPGGSSAKYLEAKALRDQLANRAWMVSRGKLPDPRKGGIPDGLTTSHEARSGQLRPRRAKVNPATVTVKECAEFTHLSPKTIRRRIADGTIPICPPLGRRVRIPKTFLVEHARGTYRTPSK